jgi:hypothetical protein
MRTIHWCGFTVLLLLAAPACKRPERPAPIAADIPGVYFCNFESEAQTLEILGNGRYRQRISRDSDSLVNDGDWNVDETEHQYSDDLRVSLKSYHVPIEPRLEGAGTVANLITSVQQNEESVWLVIFDGAGLHCSRDKAAHRSTSKN